MNLRFLLRFLPGAFAAILAVPADAAPGDRDTTFNTVTTGAVFTSAIQPDGKIIIGGNFTHVNGTSRSRIARLNPDGSLSGTIPFTYILNLNGVFSTAVQTDGKLIAGAGVRVIADESYIDFARLNVDGSRDNSFVGPNTDNVFASWIQPDGKILIGGDFRNADKPRYMLRLTTVGQVDTTFLPTVDGTNSEVSCMAVQSDGKIIVGGTFTSVGGVTRNRIARMLANGQLDTAFNPNAGTMFSPRVNCIAIQADGKILVGGNFTAIGGGSSNRFARLLPDGRLDTSFVGTVTMEGGNPAVRSITVQTDGKILIAGQFTTASSQTRNGLALLNPDGSLDSGFRMPAINADSDAGAAMIQADGKVVLSGRFRVDGGSLTDRLVRLLNYPATESLTVSSVQRVQWLRGGSLPEAHQVSLELSTSGGTTWTPLGNGSRIPGGWQWTGLALPSGGQLRAFARIGTGQGNRASGLLSRTALFVLAPEIAVYDGPDTNAPPLADGQTGTISLGEVRLGAPMIRDFTISNTGNANLRVDNVSIPQGYSGLNLPTLPADLAPGTSRTFQLRLNALEVGTFAGEIVISSNDTDEPVFEFSVTGSVVSPEISVFDGSTVTAPEITDGQMGAVDFGTVRQSSPVIRGLTIGNAGTAPLLVSTVSVPAGFTLLNTAALPAAIAINQSISLNIRLDAVALGTFNGTILINSDDFDEGAFDFPLTGTVVSPEIALHDGLLSGPELTDAQAAQLDFGRNVQGTPGRRSFTISNIGTAPLLVGSLTVPPGYTVLNLPALPLTVDINQSATFQISLTTLAVGTHAGSVTIASDDLDEAVFDFPIMGEVFIPDPVASIVSTSTTLNRQTGLREQSIHIANDTTATVPAYNLIIRGLPVGVEVNNASETRPDGSVVVYIRQAMQPHSTQDVLIEYYSPTRSPAEINPQLSTEVVLNPPDLSVAAVNLGFAIDRVARLPGAEIIIEFASVPGRLYQVQYSDDGAPWQSSLPSIRAAANRTQWIDRGLPRTHRHPMQSAGRFYRVKELTP